MFSKITKEESKQLKDRLLRHRSFNVNHNAYHYSQSKHHVRHPPQLKPIGILPIIVQKTLPTQSDCTPRNKGMMSQSSRITNILNSDITVYTNQLIRNVKPKPRKCVHFEQQ